MYNEIIAWAVALAKIGVQTDFHYDHDSEGNKVVYLEVIDVEVDEK